MQRAEQHSNNFGRRLAAVLLLAALLLAGCESSSTLIGQVADPPTPTVEPDSYNGTITVVGSAVVAPLVMRAAAEFNKLSPEAFILVFTSTSQLGLSTLLDDGADIAMTDVSSGDLLEGDNAYLSEYLVAGVPYAVIVHPSNTLSNLTGDQLHRIYEGYLSNWSDLGGTDQAIVALHATRGSGLRELFTRRFMAHERGVAEDHGSIQANSSSSQVSEVARRPGAISYTPLASVTSDVKVITVNHVQPSLETVASGRYSFWGYARFYTKHPADGLTHVFLNYLRSTNVQNQLVAPLGFVPLSRLEGRRQP